VSPQLPQPEGLDLPDLDKAEEGDEVDVGPFELSLGDEPDEVPENEALHDAFEVDIQLLTDSGDSEAATDLDVGVSDMLDELPDAPRDRDSDAPAPAGDDLDSHLDTPLGSDEPSSDEELGDDGLEVLPELTIEDGDGDAGPDVEGTLLPSAPEGEIAAGPSYSAEWLLLGAPATALAAGENAVLAAADHLMRFGAERTSDALPPGVRVSSLAALGPSGAALATTRGLLERGAGGDFTLAEMPDAARGGGADMVELATAPGQATLWARLENGVLLRRRGGIWERQQAGGNVRSLTSQEQRITLLVVSHRPTLQLSSDAGASFRELLLPEPAASVALGANATAVSHQSVVALADAARGLCVSSDGGETFRMVTGAVNATAVAIGEHAGKPAVFVALYREGKDLTELVMVDPSSGKAGRIAELNGEPEEDAEETGRASALFFGNGYLWAAGGFGLARLRA
jgi:hypothetical protein